MTAPSTTPATSLREAFNYKTVRYRAKVVLDALAEGAVVSPEGFATRALHERVAARLKADEVPKLNLLTGNLGTLEHCGWVTRETKGRRVYRIELGATLPTDYSPTMATPSRNGRAALAAVPEPEPEPDVLEVRAAVIDTITRVELEALGMRPGRLAARIEREVPDIIEQAVRGAFHGLLADVLGAFGFTRADAAARAAFDEMSAQVERHRAEAATAAERVTELEAEVRTERRYAHDARTERNRALARSLTIESSPVRANDLEEAWRTLGAHAIANQWTIHRTNGGHLAWRSPAGAQYFSSSTSSDHRAVHNARHDMEGMGLPRGG